MRFFVPLGALLRVPSFCSVLLGLVSFLLCPTCTARSVDLFLLRVASFCFVSLFVSFCFVSLFASFCFVVLSLFASFYFVLLRFSSFCFVLLLLNVLWDLFLLRFASFCFVLRLPLLFHHLCNVSCHFMTSGPCVAHVLDMTSLFFLRPLMCICRLVAPWGLCAKQSPTWSIHTGLALGQAMWHEASMKPTSPEVRITLELVGLRTPPSGQDVPKALDAHLGPGSGAFGPDAPVSRRHRPMLF